MAQGSSYLSKNLTINNSRYNSERTLGDRTITSNTINGKRYFSSTDASIYFGGLESIFVDDITQISWSMEQATMPIYGYNSYTFDDLAVGARQISGNFMVNFTKSGFLYEVLNTVEPVSRSSYYDGIPDKKNINWESLFQKEHLPAWDRSFNIIIGYGDYSMGGTNSTMTLLYCVQLNGYQQVLGVDGGPISEIYSFIAKDIRYEINSLPAISDGDVEGTPVVEPLATERFKFNISGLKMDLSSSIKGFITPESYETGTTLDTCTMGMDYSYSGGELQSVYITFKNDLGVILFNTAIPIPTDKLKSYKIPSKYVSDIYNAIADQKKRKLSSLYLYCDFTIEYKKKDGDNYFYYLKKQRMNVFKPKK